MVDLLHDLHLHINLLIQYTILHEASLLEFLGSEWNTIQLSGDLVHNRKSSFANRTYSVVLVAALPLSELTTG
jgi:hypothetical protein